MSRRCSKTAHRKIRSGVNLSGAPQNEAGNPLTRLAPRLPYNIRNKGFAELCGLDKIDWIVEQAIDYTVTVLLTAPAHVAAARTGLERLRSDLSRGDPDHPALDRLQRFLADLQLRSPARSLH